MATPLHSAPPSPTSAGSSSHNDDIPPTTLPDGTVVQHKHGIEYIDETAEGPAVVGEPPIKTTDIVLDPPPSQVPQPKIVGFDDDDKDPLHPRNFALGHRIRLTLLGGFLAFGASFGSSTYTPAVGAVSQRYHVDEEVAILGLSLYVFGFAFGPLLFGPLSEFYGRRLSIFPAYFIFVCFMFASASSETIQGLLIERFFCGFFSSAPLSIVGGIMSDIFPPRTRGMAVILYSLAIMGGPTLGPMIGSAFIIRGHSYRWTMYLPAIVSVVALILGFFFLTETYAPIILCKKAAKLRKTTGDITYRAPHEMRRFSTKYLFDTYLTRPIKMLIYEPIMLFVTLYLSFVYAILYMNFESIPIVFEETRGWNLFQSSLVFLAITTGVLIAAFIQVISQQMYVKRVDKSGPRPPEERLYMMILGSFVFAIGLFWFAWSADPPVHFMMPVIGVAIVGLGFLLIFQNGLNYLLDCFSQYAASAIAATTFVRSLFGGAFPLIARPMYHNLDNHWAGSLLGFISILLIPVPIIFLMHGPSIRAAGRFHPM